MISGARGILVLAVIACALAFAALAEPQISTAVDRAVLPGFAGHATAMHWKRPRGATVDLLADAYGTWTMATPRALVDQRAVEAVLASLRGARWHRRGDRARAGEVRATLTFTTLFDAHTIEIADPILGADQVWIVVDGTAMLVDGWLARSLDPDPLVLRDRNPLGEPATAPRIAITGADQLTLELHGQPPRLPVGLVSPPLHDALVRALERLQLVRLPDRPLDAPPPDAVTIEAPLTVVVGGPCPGDPRLIALRAETGDGCVDPDAWHDVTLAVHALTAAPADVIDRRPAGFPIASIELPDGLVTLAKRSTVATGARPAALPNGSAVRSTVTIAGAVVPADPDRVAELVHALAEPAVVETHAVSPPSAAGPHLVITLTTGTTITLIRRGDLVARADETVLLRPSPEVRAILDRPARALVDATRWVEDPSIVASLVIDGVAFNRGAVFGEWESAKAVSPAEAAVVDALAAAIAQVRAPLAELPAAWRPLRKVVVWFAPPVGARFVHTVELGPASATGCSARIDNVGVTAPLALCTAALAVAKP